MKIRFVTLLILGTLSINQAFAVTVDQDPFAGVNNPDKNEDLSVTQNCRDSVTTNLAIEHRLFRSTIFGEPSPADAAVGHVTFSTETDSWIKTAEDSWRSMAEGYEGTTWSDSLMESMSAIPERKGIFETKRLLTSDLIPYITNNMRTFDCRMRIFCDAVVKSAQLGKDSDIFAGSASSTPASLAIRISGCEPIEFPVITACISEKAGIDQDAATDALSYCESVRTGLYEREKSLMVLSTEYDAAYRSTVQFAGDFDLFLEQIRWPMTNTIRQVSGIIGNFHRIPCFVASCEDGINFPDFNPNSSSSSSF